MTHKDGKGDKTDVNIQFLMSHFYLMDGKQDGLSAFFSRFLSA